MKSIFSAFLLSLFFVTVCAQEFNQIDENGQITQFDQNTNRNFNKHNNDTTKNKEIPKGLYVWTIDRKFGDITKAVPDTVPNTIRPVITTQQGKAEYSSTVRFWDSSFLPGHIATL